MVARFGRDLARFSRLLESKTLISFIWRERTFMGFASVDLRDGATERGCKGIVRIFAIACLGIAGGVCYSGGDRNRLIKYGWKKRRGNGDWACVGADVTDADAGR